jgi:hypothetical protein
MSAHSCSAYPDVQAKIRRVVQQGHIDAEDFNGVCDKVDGTIDEQVHRLTSSGPRVQCAWLTRHSWTREEGEGT